MESNGARLNFPLLCSVKHLVKIRSVTQSPQESTNLDVDFVPTQDNRDIFADTFEITMPIRHILIRDPGCDIKHDDSTLSLDVVTVTKSTELLLPGRVPDIETNSAKVGEEL